MITVTGGEAKEKVLIVPKEGRFEASRKLPHLHDSYGNMNAMERFNKLMNVQRRRRMHEAPRAVENWEQEWATYTHRAGEVLPEKMRTNSTPASCRRTSKRKFAYATPMRALSTRT